MKQRAIFLDRDGVLNHAIIKNGKPFAPLTLDELSIPDDAFAALSRLKVAGFLLIGATNQPDVARGTTTRETIEAINARMMEVLPLDEIRVCFHDDSHQCLCRKPLPGLLTQAAADFKIDLNNSVMIGDRWKDIDAGQRAGCQTILLRQDYQEEDTTKTASYTASSLTDATNWILTTLIEKR